MDGFVGTPGIHVSVFAKCSDLLMHFFRVFQDHLASLALQDSLAATALTVVMEIWALKVPRDPKDHLDPRDSKVPRENPEQEA